MKTSLLMILMAPVISACTSQEDISQREAERIQEERFIYQEQQAPRIR
jgi:hypothetical protein